MRKTFPYFWGWFDKQWYVNNAMIYTTRTKLFIFGVGIIWLTLWFATASSLSSSTHLHFWPEKFPPKLRAQRWAACLAWRSMPKVWAKVNWNHTNYHPHMVLVIEQLGWITKYPDKTWDIFWVWWWIDLAIYMGKGLYECKLMNFNLKVKLGSTQVWEGKEI